jgi:small-conductance mechanosensitive channel
LDRNSIIPGWVHHPMPTRPTSQHVRSFSTVTKRSESPANRVSRAISASALHTMAAVANSPALRSSGLHTSYQDDDENMSTIPDPRSRTMSPADDLPPSPSQHPDLNNEVATLSNKLINAINHQTNLDDTLSATRHDLETARERIRQLESESKNHAYQIEHGLLVKSDIVDAERRNLLASLDSERKQRKKVEAEKKQIDEELIDLSKSLIEEAQNVSFDKVLFFLFAWLTAADGPSRTRRSGKRPRSLAAEKRSTQSSAC